MTDDKLARWLWDFVESFFAEADSRKPVAWEDFLHMPGVGVGWWRSKAAELRALLQEDAVSEKEGGFSDKPEPVAKIPAHELTKLEKEGKATVYEPQYPLLLFATTPLYLHPPSREPEGWHGRWVALVSMAGEWVLSEDPEERAEGQTLLNLLKVIEKEHPTQSPSREREAVAEVSESLKRLPAVEVSPAALDVLAACWKKLDAILATEDGDE